MMTDAPSKDEMLSCLQRSGYLLEGRLVKSLNALGLFVEPSQVLLDERTGVSREIDLVAEGYRPTPERPKVCVRTTFIIEAINNLYPVVLLTPRLWTPNSPFEDYLQYKVTPSEKCERHPFLWQIDPFEMRGTHNWEIFSQYCAFTRKKQGELMADHPDDLHDSIRKAVEYLFIAKDEYHSWMDEKDDDYWRLFQWQALVVLQNELFVLQADEDQVESLLPVTNAKLEYNFHFRGEPKTTVVDFVVESALPEFVRQMLAYDDNVEERMFMLRSENS